MKVVVIGSGMSGLVAAGYLTQAGHEVIVCEQFPTVGGEKRQPENPVRGMSGEAVRILRTLSGVARRRSKIRYSQVESGVLTSPGVLDRSPLPDRLGFSVKEPGRRAADS
jgi:glycine/D-amino acid oxidase-like deaminating enzyme